MNDRCRVFALNGEELFPCRWAKAKKLVAANVAKKATIDGKMCIKMLEPTRMNKPQEAIMDNERFPKKLYQYISEGSKITEGYILEYIKDTDKEEEDRSYYHYSIYNDKDDDVDFKNVLDKEIDIFAFGCEKPIEAIDAESNFELEVSPVRVSLVQAQNDKRFFQSKKLKELRELTSKLANDLDQSKPRDNFKFPNTLYQFNSEANVIVVFKFDCVSNEKFSTYTFNAGIDKIQKTSINGDFICNNSVEICNLSRYGGWPFRTKLHLAMEDFEWHRTSRIDDLEDELKFLRLNKIPQIIE